MNKDYMHKLQIISFCLIVSLSIVFVSCNKETVNDEGNITLSFQNGDVGNYKSASEYPTDSIDAAVVSIKDQNNNYKYDNQVIKLLKLDGQFISTPLKLKPGNYKLSAFMLIDKSGNVLLITPMKGSTYAYLVNNPLEIEFTISKNTTTHLVPEVISSSGHKPKDFGYAFFSFLQIKTFDLFLSVFSSNGSSVEFTNSYVTITHNEDTIFQDSLHAIPNVLKLPEVSGDYKFLITKNGYPDFSETYALDSLKLHSIRASDPLIILFKKVNNSGLVLWNTLGSEQEITHSKVGPNLFFYDPAIDGGTGMADIIAQPEFSMGKYGNALTIGPSSSYGGREHNVILRDVRKVINYKQGCIELWYYQTDDPLAYSHGDYRLWDGDWGFNPGITFFTTDPSYGPYGGLFIFLINSVHPIILKYNPGASIRNNHNLNNRWLHLAAVWNIDGIDKTGNTMRIYIDGKIVASGQDSGWGDIIGNKVDICGGQDGDVVNKFYMDNLKVWNYAKTDFSDRFSE